MRRFVVVGGGGHARVLIAVLRDRGDEVIGYTDRDDHGRVMGAPYRGGDDVLPSLATDDPELHLAVGVGMITANVDRGLLLARLAALGLPMPAVVARRAVVHEDVVLGDATVVYDGVVANPGVRTGPGCILNTNCTVEHDVRLGRNVHVAPGASLSGGIEIGDDVMIGVGATAIQGVRIVDGVTVGAGAVVTRDLTEAGVYVGTPATRVASKGTGR